MISKPVLNKSSPRISCGAYWVTGVGFLILYLPLIVLVIDSFLEHSDKGSSHSWSLKWYEQLFADQPILEALALSLKIAAWNTIGSTLIGTAAAIALAKAQFPGKKMFEILTYLPLILPEIVLGLALLIWFVMIRFTLGQESIILAHITFSLSYVIITVKSRLQGFDLSLEEAAKDLGASAWKIFSKITLPLIWPGILSGALMAFTLSFDDFLITFFTAGVGADPLPLKIYTMIKFGVTPELNALSTLLLCVTFASVLVFFRPWLKSSTS